jgi:hypothetical protein
MDGVYSAARSPGPGDLLGSATEVVMKKKASGAGRLRARTARAPKGSAPVAPAGVVIDGATGKMRRLDRPEPPATDRRLVAQAMRAMGLKTTDGTASLTPYVTLSPQTPFVDAKGLIYAMDVGYMDPFQYLWLGRDHGALGGSFYLLQKNTMYIASIVVQADGSPLHLSVAGSSETVTFDQWGYHTIMRPFVAEGSVTYFGMRCENWSFHRIEALIVE